MSGILAVIGPVRDSRAESALAPLSYLGGDREQVWSGEDALVVVTRKEWQLSDDFSGPVLVLEGPDLVIAADASLYDRKGLSRELATAGVKARGDTPSHFIEAAYRAWGPALVEHLNGDYAFVVWDRRNHRLFAGRDAIGGRPLYWTRIDSGIAVASSCRSLAELRGTPTELNLANLSVQVAGFAWSVGMDTAYRGVDPILPGHRLTWQDGGTHLETWWRPREATERRPRPIAEAAEELRDILGAAVGQRMSSGITTVWMSGGWDSTAVFAAGQHALEPGKRSQLRPVSISYPVGDPGCEDEFIKQVAGRWEADVHWLRIDDLGLLEGLEERAGRADEPTTSLYELWNRGLAKGSRAAGARIAMDGGGGDQLFAVSEIIMADLLRTGHWSAFSRFARSRKGYGWRHLVRTGVLPLVPDPIVRAAEVVLRRRIPRHYLERAPSGWVRREFAGTHRLRERELHMLRLGNSSGYAQDENRRYLTLPIWSWGSSAMRGSLLQEGVESRSPLLDLHVIEFALGRPVIERSNGTETKLLLRRAMEGLIPPGVLAPRRQRTGVTLGFSRSRMREGYPALFRKIFDAPLRLEELGIVDGPALRSAADRYLNGDSDDSLRMNLFYVAKTEFWLRGLERRPRGGRSRPGIDMGELNLPAA